MTRKESALLAVRRACRLTRAVQASLVSEETVAKKDRSPVTVADFGAQAIISRELFESRPQDPILGEEDAAHLRTPDGRAVRERVVEAVREAYPENSDLSEAGILDAIDRCATEDGSSSGYWVLDPIDGTKGFLRRGQYAIALAWVVDHRVELGLLGCPSLPEQLPEEMPEQIPETWGSILVAERGRGTMRYDLEGRELGPAQVRALSDQSDPGDLADARFLESVEAAHSAHDRHQRIADLLGVTTPPVRIDSQCKYAVLARGDAAIYLRLPRSETYQEKVWDHAAGLLVVEEAGGRVTDAEGRPLDFSHGRTLAKNRGIVATSATSGSIHERVLEAVRATA